MAGSAGFTSVQVLMDCLIPHLLSRPTALLTRSLDGLPALLLAQRKPAAQCPPRTRYVFRLSPRPPVVGWLSAERVCFQYGDVMLTAGRSGQTGIFFLPSPGVTADCVDASPAGNCSLTHSFHFHSNILNCQFISH